MRGNAIVPALLEGAGWWVVLVMLWWATVDPLDAVEVALSVVCAVPCALAARGTRRAVGARWKVRARWTRWVAVLPAVVVADTARIAVLSVRGRARRGGRERLRRLPPEPDPVVAFTRRALAAAAVSATPGSVVFGVAADPDGLCLHELGSGRPVLDPRRLR